MSKISASLILYWMLTFDIQLEKGQPGERSSATGMVKGDNLVNGASPCSRSYTPPAFHYRFYRIAKP